MYGNILSTEVLKGILPSLTAPFRIPPFAVKIAFHFIPIVVASYAYWDKYADFLKSQSLDAYLFRTIETYDFIIVGAGSAGTVLANRLSASGQFRVLLLESGGNMNPMQTVPLYAPMLLDLPEVAYEFYTVPQENTCLGLRHHRSYWPRGMGLGGTSNLNAMFFQKGHKYDYDRWAELSGSDEWNFENVVRNFKNIEDYHGPNFNEKWHSNDGNGVYVSVTNETRMLPEFLEAGREMGYPTKDLNGLQEASFSWNDVTIKNGRRHSGYAAFLEPALRRKNLQVYRYARVSNIKFDKDKRATGLTYRRHGIQRYVRARKEIIISAGAVDSPKLLMLSGVGPKSHLRNLGIKTVSDLPVGKNLHDHVMTMLPFTVETVGTTVNLDRDISLEMISQYFDKGKGILATPMLTNGMAYIHSSGNDNGNNDKSPDIQLYMQPSAPMDTPLYEKISSFKKAFFSPYFRNPKKKDGFIIEVLLAKVESRGYLKLASSNPNDKPIIDPKYFTHPDDMPRFVAGMNFTVTMIENTQAFRKHGTRLLTNKVPSCRQYRLKSLDYYECIARHMTMTIFHPCGTCSMGKGPDDPNAVVDPKLRVIGTKGLRVVDASIIPEIPNSNLNAAVYMIADKASEFILGQWQRRD